MAKKKQSQPSYIPTGDEQEAYKYCVRNGIRVSPGAIQGKPDLFKIEISTDGKNWHKSPSDYSLEILWQEYYKVCAYYYEKSKK